MRFSDILAMSAGNLWKRKVRSVLTILGVMIGTASIVVMLSLGIGLKSAMLGQIQSEGSMTDIQVYNYGSGNDGAYQQLNDDKVKELIEKREKARKEKNWATADAIRDELKNMNADFVFLGSGDSSYENLLIWLSNNTSNIRAYIGYKADLANQIYAGSDFFLMPSKFEPCGLSQLIAMRYGSLPIVRATGGLDNTVVGYPLDNSTGFKFWGYDGWQMKEAIDCAIGVYKDKYTFNAMRKSAMESDFSWRKSSQEYLKLYKSLL